MPWPLQSLGQAGWLRRWPPSVCTLQGHRAATVKRLSMTHTGEERGCMVEG
jgi:hypothetical protein